MAGANVSKITVSDVLEYYRGEVIPVLAAAITIDDEFPEEVLNEIRNSFTHLARANNLSEKTHRAERQDELKAALRHLKRTALDSLKDAILVLAQRSERVIEALTEDINLPNGVYQQMADLRRRRKELATHEGQEPTDHIVDKLKTLFNDYDEFYVGLEQHYAGDTAEMRRNARRRRRWIDRMWGFALGLVASAIVAAGMSLIAGG